jgi:hypothetical protein
MSTRLRMPRRGGSGSSGSGSSVNERVSHEKKEARSEGRVEEQRTAEGHRPSGSDVVVEGSESSDGSVDKIERRGRASSREKGKYPYRNPDKWRAYMRVYMRKKRHKVK